MNISRYRGLLVMVIDMLMIIFCNTVLFLPALLRQDIQLPNLIIHILLLTACFALTQMAFRTYDSLWRYAESREYLLLLTGMAVGFALYCMANLLLDTNAIWITQAVTGTALALLAMLLLRFLYRIYRRNQVKGSAGPKKAVAIIGAGLAGTALAAELLSAPDSRYAPYCFIDDSAEKRKKRIQGIPVYGPIDDLEEILRDTPVTDMVLAIQKVDPERRVQIMNACTKVNCRLRILEDPVTQMNKAQSDHVDSQLRMVQIEDLLGREPVRMNNRKLAGWISGKTVLVTGGGGSIGTELCMQIAAYHPQRLVVLDIAENPVYDLQNELYRIYGRQFPLSAEIASVRDSEKLEQLFACYRPQLVFHAAAHKHVPLMESCPEEAVKNNVLGTWNTAVAARKYHAEKFVLISSDKAVNPTNVMGTTKQICEQILRAVGSTGTTEFAAVRFGNVLGSNGSVLPLFARQIAHGGPVTITDKRIIRYFMTIPEAVQLVLEASSYAANREIYVLDMGEPVLIAELAEKMIRLSGRQPYTDIPIVEIGLRPGEKLYEELLTDNACLGRTENEKIFVEQTAPVDEAALAAELEQLAAAAGRQDRQAVLRKLRQLVPTFRSPEIVNGEALCARLAGAPAENGSAKMTGQGRMS